LICSNCKKVKEIVIDRHVIDQLNNEVAQAGYQMTKSQIELECLCDDCQ
jgi:Fur family zinc uptake transcriptional regulator